MSLSCSLLTNSGHCRLALQNCPPHRWATVWQSPTWDVMSSAPCIEIEASKSSVYFLEHKYPWWVLGLTNIGQLLYYQWGGAGVLEDLVLRCWVQILFHTSPCFWTRVSLNLQKHVLNKSHHFDSPCHTAHQNTRMIGQHRVRSQFLQHWFPLKALTQNTPRLLKFHRNCSMFVIN